ncbi:hypothetical protein ANCDUO_19507 [Ancylostoma duodenale]|uniref:Uncharacterized protein n=1 Tax=Ancylostoma duodenale TaxID=51022 RepID=A0A0C2FUS6_9BILA|nr:hypothetical protein ANCDUO_19507 [Ancylostoma duodenale]
MRLLPTHFVLLFLLATLDDILGSKGGEDVSSPSKNPTHTEDGSNMTTPKMQPANAHEAPKKESSHNADPYNGNEEVDEDDLMDGSTTDPSTEPPPSDPDTPATDEEAVSNTETDSTTPLTSPETESPDEEVFSPIPDSSTTSEDEQLSEQLRNNGTNGTTVENGVDGEPKSSSSGRYNLIASTLAFLFICSSLFLH